MDTKNICIFDIDGTLANCDHRLHHIKNKPKNWPAFYNGCMDDVLISPVAEMLDLYSKFYKIYLVTGRPENNRHLTESWLDAHKIKYDNLIMRGDRDFRKSPEFKSSVCDMIEAEGQTIFFVVEDRPDCVQMFINRGIFVFDVSNGSSHDA